MLTATLRGMVAHKLRLVLTTASIALGVAFLAGTLVLTDTMGLAFDQLFGKVSAGTDAVVRTQAAYTASRASAPAGPRSPPPSSTDVPKVDGVRAAEGSVSGYALLTDNDGQAILTNGGAPTHGLQHAAPTKTCAATSTCSRARPATPRTRSPSTPPAPRTTTSRSARPSRCCSRARPRSSPSSAPSASAARRTSAAPRRRTSTPRPPRRCSAAPASSTRST